MPSVIAAYEIAIAHRDWFGRASALWLAGLSALGMLACFAPPSPQLGSPLAIALRYGELLGAILLCLAWLRAMLSHEPPSLLSPIGRRELRFLGYTVLVILIVVGILYFGATMLLLMLTVVAIDVGFTPIPKWATDVYQIAALVVFLAPGCGSLLALPAIATDEQGELLARAWRRSRGNALRIALGLLLCVAPFQGLKLAMESTIGRPFWELFDKPVMTGAITVPLPWQTAVATEFDLLLSFFGTAVLAGFLGLVYRQLADAGESDDAAPSSQWPARPSAEAVDRLG